MPRRITIRVTPEARAALEPALGRGLQALRGLLRTGATATLERERIRDASIEITVVDDASITEMNERYLGHDGPTDVIAFALHQAGDPPEADIYISAEQAARQAERFGVEVREELLRLAVHGTLHVLGYDHDHTDGDARTRGEMWAVQEAIVAKVCET